MSPRQWGLSKAHAKVLQFIHENQQHPLSSREIAARVGLSRSTIQLALDRLNELQLIRSHGGSHSNASTHVVSEVVTRVLVGGPKSVQTRPEIGPPPGAKSVHPPGPKSVHPLNKERARAKATSLRSLEAKLSSLPKGKPPNPELRAEIAAALSRSRLEFQGERADERTVSNLARHLAPLPGAIARQVIDHLEHQCSYIQRRRKDSVFGWGVAVRIVTDAIAQLAPELALPPRKPVLAEKMPERAVPLAVNAPVLPPEIGEVDPVVQEVLNLQSELRAMAAAKGMR